MPGHREREAGRGASSSAFFSQDGLASAPEKLLGAHGLGSHGQRPLPRFGPQVVVRQTPVLLEPLSAESQTASEVVQFLEG
jgi:hypothetical protein